MENIEYESGAQKIELRLVGCNMTLIPLLQSSLLPISLIAVCLEQNGGKSFRGPLQAIKTQINHSAESAEEPFRQAFHTARTPQPSSCIARISALVHSTPPARAVRLALLESIGTQTSVTRHRHSTPGLYLPSLAPTSCLLRADTIGRMILIANNRRTFDQILLGRQPRSKGLLPSFSSSTFYDTPIRYR